MMKRLLTLILFSLSGSLLYAGPQNDSVFNRAAIQSFLSSVSKVGNVEMKEEGDGYKLFIFLSPECPLCQQASAGLNKLFEQYNNKVAFYGIVPGKTYSVIPIKFGF